MTVSPIFKNVYFWIAVVVIVAIVVYLNRDAIFSKNRSIGGNRMSGIQQTNPSNQRWADNYSIGALEGHYCELQNWINSNFPPPKGIHLDQTKALMQALAEAIGAFGGTSIRCDLYGGMGVSLPIWQTPIQKYASAICAIKNYLKQYSTASESQFMGQLQNILMQKLESMGYTFYSDCTVSKNTPLGRPVFLTDVTQADKSVSPVTSPSRPRIATTTDIEGR